MIDLSRINIFTIFANYEKFIKKNLISIIDNKRRNISQLSLGLSSVRLNVMHIHTCVKNLRALTKIS